MSTSKAENSSISRETYLAAVNRIEKLEGVLKRANAMCVHALPQFNWGASALDATAIRFLNEVPAEIAEVLR
jgi:hypothetical protein